MAWGYTLKGGPNDGEMHSWDPTDLWECPKQDDTLRLINEAGEVHMYKYTKTEDEMQGRDWRPVCNYIGRDAVEEAHIAAEKRTEDAKQKAQEIFKAMAAKGFSEHSYSEEEFAQHKATAQEQIGCEVDLRLCGATIHYLVLISVDDDGLCELWGPDNKDGTPGLRLLNIPAACVQPVPKLAATSGGNSPWGD